MADVIAGVLPEHQVSILAGASGAGKTTLLMQIIKFLQDGTDVFGHNAIGGLKIGYLAADRTWEAYKLLADTIQVDLDRLVIQTLVDDPDIDLTLFEKNPQGLMYQLLTEMVRKGANLLVVDPLISLMGGDPNRYNQMAPRLIRLNRFCLQNKVTIMGVHHAGKARTDFGFKRAQDRISGSSALLGFTSTHLFLAAAEEIQQEYCEWHIVSHHAKAEVVRLKRTDPHGLFAEYTMDDAICSTSKKSAMGWDEILHMMPLDGTPISRADIIASFKGAVSERLIDGLLQQLLEQGLIEKCGRGMYRLKVN